MSQNQTQGLNRVFHEAVIYVSADEARDSKEARLVAWSDVQSTQGVMAPVYLKVSSCMANRSRGGWTFCFTQSEEPRYILRKKEAIVKELKDTQEVVDREMVSQHRQFILEPLYQRIWTLEWVLSMRDCL